MESCKKGTQVTTTIRKVRACFIGCLAIFLLTLSIQYREEVAESWNNYVKVWKYGKSKGFFIDCGPALETLTNEYRELHNLTVEEFPAEIPKCQDNIEVSVHGN